MLGQIVGHHVAVVLGVLLNNPDAKSVLRHVAKDLVVKVTRYRRPDKRSRGTSYVLTVGKPNYRETKELKIILRGKVRLPAPVTVRLFPKKKKK